MQIHQNEGKLERSPHAVAHFIARPGILVSNVRQTNRRDKPYTSAPIILPALKRQAVVQLLHQHGKVHILKSGPDSLILLEKIHPLFHAGKAGVAIVNMTLGRIDIL